jgi:histidinol-phosphate aminotransferase
MTAITRRAWLQSSLLASSALLIPHVSTSYTAARRANKQIEEIVQELILLNYNENPWGPSEKAKKAIIDSLHVCNRYPDEQVENLKKAIARQNDVDPRQVFISAGSTEILSLLGQHVGLLKGEILTPWPSFPTMLYAGETAGATIKKIDLDKEDKMDLAAMKAAISGQTKMILLCNPNNPSSTEVDTNSLKEFIKSVPPDILICVDEAYIEYSKNGLKGSMMQLTKELNNLIIARTFSKVYGLAGLRIGYAISNRGNIEQMQMMHPGREIATNISALAAAHATFTETDFVEQCVKKNQEGKEIVYNAYEKWGVSSAESATSFIYTRHKHFDADIVRKMKNDNGILITKWPIMKDHIRISIGKPEEMEKFVKAAEQYLI